MISKKDVLRQAINDCLKELFSLAQPKIEWEDFVKQCEDYSNKYEQWEQFRLAWANREKNSVEWESIQKEHPTWKPEDFIDDLIGPKPIEFYYIPKEIMKEVCDSYIYAYGFDEQQNLLEIIEILKNYCKEPIVDEYIDAHTDEQGNYTPGYKDYVHPNNLRIEIANIISNYSLEPCPPNDDEVTDICNKFFEFLDMAGNFFNWTKDLNTFNMSVYLGSSPCTNKETVIYNWKKFRNKDIIINENEYNDE